MNKNIFECTICGVQLNYVNAHSIMCPVCGRQYPVTNNIHIFHSPPREETDIFSKDIYTNILSMETHHFWYPYRLGIVKKILHTYAPESTTKTFAEIGCGNGYMAAHLAPIFAHTCGIDMNIYGLENAANRDQHVAWACMDLGNTSKVGIKADVLGLFDVLEHVEAPVTFLTQIKKSTFSGGVLIITVPAFQWLWTQIDNLSGHKRRYTKKELIQDVQKAGFHVKFISYFMFLTFPFYVVQRYRYKILHRTTPIKDIQKYTSLPNFLNTCGLLLGNIERHLMTHIKFLFGSSLICVAQL